MASKTILLWDTDSKKPKNAWWSTGISSFNSVINNNLSNNAVISKAVLKVYADFDGAGGLANVYMKYGFGGNQSISTQLGGERKLTGDETNYDTDITNYMSSKVSPFAISTAYGTYFSANIYTSNIVVSALRMGKVELYVEYTEHTHSYTTEISRTASTCCTNGSVTKQCSCGEKQTTQLALDPNNHSGGTEVRNARASTCSAEGYTGDTYCKGCGKMIGVGDIIGKKAHTEVTIPAIAPTCTETGLTAGKECSVCRNVTVAQQIVPAKGHSYASTVIPPTASADGYTNHICSGCGHSYKDNYKVNKIFDDTVQPSGVLIDTSVVKEIYIDTTKVWG